MRLNKNCCIILLIFLAAGFAFQSKAQSLDSLENALRSTSLPVDEQLKIYDDLSWGNLSVDISKSMKYAKAGLKLAKKVGNEKMIGILNRNVGVAYYMASDYDSANIFLDQALQNAIKRRDESLEARVLLAKANLYNQTSDYPKALAFYLKALKIFEAQSNSERAGVIYHNIGSMYQRLNNNDQAIVYFNKSIGIARETGNLESEGFTLMALTNLYMDDEPAEAIRLATRSMEIFKETGNLYNEIMSVLTIAQSHYKRKAYKEASFFALKGLEMAKATDFPKLVAEAEGVLSNIHYYQGNYAQSESYALGSLEKDTSDVNLTINMMDNVARANAYLGNPDKTMEYLDKLRSWIDTYANDSYQSSLSEMEIKYESEKKELKINSLEVEKRLYTGLAITLIILMIMGFAFFIVRHRLAVSRRKIAEQQMQQLEQEKKLVAVQAALDGEAAERKRLARDLHDGLGSMLSVVKFSIPDIQSGVSPGGEEVNRLQKATALLDNSIAELRRVAHHMMPESLLEHGLKTSLADFCESVPNTDFQYFGDGDRLPEKLELMIYRSIHELVNNALKHAEAKQINVQLIQDKDRISFTVQDDGIGFRPGEVKEGMGLSNIRKRLEVYEGKMDLHSSELGTEIQVEVQLTA